MRVVLFGVSGNIGSAVAAELVGRDHVVLGVSRSGFRGAHWPSVPGDVTDSGRVSGLIAGADAVISAAGPRPGQDDDRTTIVGAALALLKGVRETGARARLVVVGGAGTLLLPDGSRLVDSPEFPDLWRANALAQAEALEVYRQAVDVEWTYVSPAAELAGASRTGSWRLGSDELLLDAAGRSRISIPDFAAAFADEVERTEARRGRVSVAY